GIALIARAPAPSYRPEGPVCISRRPSLRSFSISIRNCPAVSPDSALAIFARGAYANCMNMKTCPDCDGGGMVTRREFLKTAAAGVAVAATLPLVNSAQASKVSMRTEKSETLVSAFHKTLTEEQRKVICFPFDHPLRSKVDNNWHI